MHTLATKCTGVLTLDKGDLSPYGAYMGHIAAHMGTYGLGPIMGPGPSPLGRNPQKKCVLENVTRFMCFPPTAGTA